MALNVTTAVFGENCNTATASPSLAQWDKGQVLQISGVDLPDAYQVEFSTVYTRNAIPVIGNASGVQVPNELLQRSAPITACVVLHSTANSRDTEYWVTIHITPRKPPETITPDPEQQDVIDQAIAALQDGTARAEAAATAAAGSATEADGNAENAEAWAVGQRAGEDVPDTDPTYRNNAKYYAGAAEAAAEEAGQHEASLESWVRRAEAAADDAEGSARAAAGSKADATAAAQTATQKATEAGNSAGAAAGSASEARQTVDGSIGAINTAKEGALTAIGSAGSNAVGAVNQAGTTQTERVTTEGNTQVNRVQEKGDEVIGSIPQDYTNLVDDVADLSRQISDVEENQIPELKSAINGIDDLIKYYIYTASKTLINRFTDLKSGISLKKDIEYIATWTFSQATLETVYCYLLDSNDTNIFSGTTSMTAGESSFTVTFTPSADLDNITVIVYAQRGSGLVGTVCDFKLESPGNKIATIEKKISGLLPSAVGNMKTLMPFTVGGWGEGGIDTNKRRITNSTWLAYPEQLRIKMDDEYRVGYIKKVGDDLTWHGWYTEITIPNGTTFRLQCARPIDGTGDEITDPYDNDIMQKMTITGLENSVAELLKRLKTDYGHNGLKCETFMDYALWQQGVAHVDDWLVGFNASNDAHTNTGNYNVMEYKNGYRYHSRGNHNLGHCASADYNKETDTLIVANGTTGSVVPAIYLISNARQTVDDEADIFINSDNVMQIEFGSTELSGCMACFGETSDIIYVIFGQSGYMHLYKLVLGKGNVNMTSLYPDASFGSYVSGKGNNEYNGTARILATYNWNYDVELQGMKYINGKICVSCDLNINNVLTAYIMFVKTYEPDSSIITDSIYWIPSLTSDGSYTRTESEGVAFADGYGYVTYVRSELNDSRTIKFSLLQ